MKLQTTTEAEGYVKKVFGIPVVGFADIDINILNAFITAFEKMFDRYPETRNLISAIGNSSLIIEELESMQMDSDLDIDVKEKALDNRKRIADDNDTNPMSLIHIRVKDGNPYIAFCFNSYLRQCNLEELVSNVTIIHRNSSIAKHNKPEVVIYHEYGHFLDFLLNLSHDSDFFRIMMNKGEDSEKFYYIAHEMFAQTFAEYFVTSEPANFCEETIDFADRKYDEAYVQKEKIK